MPLLGPPLQLAGVVGLLVVASLGLGLLISIVSDSEAWIDLGYRFHPTCAPDDHNPAQKVSS